MPISRRRPSHHLLGRRSIFCAAVLLLVLPLLAACGDDDDESPTAPPAVDSATSEAPEQLGPAESPPATPDGSPGASPVSSPAPTPISAVQLAPGPDVTAEQILRFGAGKMAAIHSAHFKATVEGTVFIDDNREIQLVSAEGNVVRPDRVQAQFRIRIGDRAISSIRMVTIGEDAWMTDIITGKWVPAVEDFNYDVGVLFDPERGLAPVMLGVENPVRLDDAEVDGRATYVVEATAGEELIADVTSNTLTGYPITVRAWVDQDTGDLRKIVLIEPPSPENADPSTWTLELSQIDAEITIEPPDVDR